MKRRVSSVVAALCAAVWLAAATGLAHAATWRASRPANPEHARIEQLIRAGEMSAAVDLFDAHVEATRDVDRDLLARLAVGTLSQVARTPADRQAAVEACLTVLQVGPDPCEMRLSTEPDGPATKLRLLARRLPPDPDRAQRQVAELTADFTPDDWGSVVEAAADFPPAVAVRLLRQALAGGSDGVRFSAIEELRKLHDPAAIALLKQWSERQGVPGQFVALGAVAESGDADALAAVKTLLPELFGRDLLAAGVALSQSGDKRGREILSQLLAADEELLRLDAAAALIRFGVPAGNEYLLGGLGETNPWLRLRTLELWRALAVDEVTSGPPPPQAWRLLNDAMPWIRVRAAQLVLASTPPGQWARPTP
jgi:hypothetical protein